MDSGPRLSNIMIITEAPIVGHELTLLKQMLKHSDIDIYKCFMTSISPTQPPGRNFTHYYEDAKRKVPSSRLEKLWNTTLEKIKVSQPNVIISIGVEPLRLLTNERHITKNRGMVLFCDNIKIIPTYDIRTVMRKYEYHVICEMDFAKANKESQFSQHITPAITIQINPSILQVEYFINQCCTFPPISFDIETIGRVIRCLSLAYKDNTNIRRAICIPFLKMSGQMAVISYSMITVPHNFSGEQTSYWTEYDELRILTMLDSLFRNKDLEFWGQNSVGFDAPLLEEHLGLTITNHTLDTMHAWHILHPELPKSLDFLTSVLTDYQNYWTHKDTNNDESEFTYNCMDSIVTLDIGHTIKKELASVPINFNVKA